MGVLGSRKTSNSISMGNERPSATRGGSQGGSHWLFRKSKAHHRVVGAVFVWISKASLASRLAQAAYGQQWPWM